MTQPGGYRDIHTDVVLLRPLLLLTTASAASTLSLRLKVTSVVVVFMFNIVEDLIVKFNCVQPVLH